MRPPPAPQSNSSLSATTSRVSSPGRPSLASRSTATAGPSTPSRTVSTSSNTASSSAAMSRKPSAATTIPASRVTSAAAPPPRPPSASEATPKPGVRAPSQASIHMNDETTSLSRTTSPTPKDTSMPPPRSLISPTPSSTGMTSRPSHTRSFSSAMSSGHPPVSVPPHDRPPSRAPTPSAESASAAFALKHELEELRIKVRILEGRKVEDHDKIRSLEVKAAEADTLRSARVKLQGQLSEAQSWLKLR